jgi:hypothetical protein
VTAVHGTVPWQATFQEETEEEQRLWLSWTKLVEFEGPNAQKLVQLGTVRVLASAPALTVRRCHSVRSPVSPPVKSGPA